MKITDFRKLKLMMNMTISGSDQEKLTALAKVNEIIAKSNTTWDRILDRVIKVDMMVESVEDALRDSPGGGDKDAARAAFKRKIDEAFETILASNPKGTWAEFIDSLREQWDERAHLSKEQLDALFRGARNAEQRR